MSNLVVPTFLGRLGNQLFQVAAAIGYAKKYNTDWFIPKGYHHREIYRHWNLPIYKGNIRRLKLYDVATDEGWGYSPIPFHAGGVLLRGFFQSPLHFEHCEQDVKNVFKLQIDPVDAVSIHVRRGDYLALNQYTFKPVDMNYINQAMDIFKRIGKTKFMVVSDDLPWCRDNIKDPDCEILFSPGVSVYADLCLMASCEHHIISNSTLAYWAAYLGRNENKVVVSPSAEAPNWFLHGRMDTSNLLPKHWTQIKYR